MQNRKTFIVPQLSLALLAAIALSHPALAADIVLTPPAGSNTQINPTGGNVGIGTTSPISKIHIIADVIPPRVQSSGATGFGAGWDFYLGATGKAYVGVPDASAPFGAGELMLYGGPGTKTSLWAGGNRGITLDNISGAVIVAGAIKSPDGTTITPPCFDPNNRFTDCGDGTVYDKQTGLMWEKKEDCGGAVNLSNPHCRANTYTWTQNVAPFTEPTGTLYSDFLQLLNGLNFTGGAPCFANHCDWRIPTVGELRSILTAQYPAACPAPSPPCIAPMFGPTQASAYWSASSLASNPVDSWGVNFGNGFVGIGGYKFSSFHGRAVRSGR